VKEKLGDMKCLYPSLFQLLTSEGVVALEETMQVTHDEAKAVIGPSGAMVKVIRNESGATVVVEDKIDPCTIQITGSYRTVDRARAMIREVLWEIVGSGMAGGGRRGPRRKRAEEVEWEDEEMMKVSFDDSKRIIGKAGVKISEIQKTSGARVEVGKSTGEPVMVRIQGSYEAVAQACAMVQKTLPNSFRKAKPGEIRGAQPPQAWREQEDRKRKRDWGEKSDWSSWKDSKKWSEEGWNKDSEEKWSSSGGGWSEKKSW